MKKTPVVLVIETAPTYSSIAYEGKKPQVSYWDMEDDVIFKSLPKRPKKMPEGEDTGALILNRLIGKNVPFSLYNEKANIIYTVVPPAKDKFEQYANYLGVFSAILWYGRTVDVISLSAPLDVSKAITQEEYTDNCLQEALSFISAIEIIGRYSKENKKLQKLKDDFCENMQSLKEKCSLREAILNPASQAMIQKMLHCINGQKENVPQKNLELLKCAADQALSLLRDEFGKLPCITKSIENYTTQISVLNKGIKELVNLLAERNCAVFSFDMVDRYGFAPHSLNEEGDPYPIPEINGNPHPTTDTTILLPNAGIKVPDTYKGYEAYIDVAPNEKADMRSLIPSLAAVYARYKTTHPEGTTKDFFKTVQNEGAFMEITFICAADPIMEGDDKIGGYAPPRTFPATIQKTRNRRNAVDNVFTRS